MKNINKILFFLIATVLSWSCEKEEDKLYLTNGIAIDMTLSKNEIVLKKEQAQPDTLTVAWGRPNYGYKEAVKYRIFFDKKGNNFAKPIIKETGIDLKRKFTHSELNDIALQLGGEPDKLLELDMKVEAFLGEATKILSQVKSVKLTPYSTKLNLSSNWGLVGDATPNGWDGPDAPLYKIIGSDKLVAYVKLKDGEFKFRTNNAWTTNLGGTTAELKQDGSNIKVTAGSYKIELDVAAKKYTIEKFSWGVVGDATTNGWNGPDQVLSYDPNVDLWRAVVDFKTGEYKFRLNNDWGVNYGGVNGVFASDNIKVTVGKYLVLVDFKNKKYEALPYKSWGLVGSATANGWDGPDQDMTLDLSTGTYFIYNVSLKVGEMKFRPNNIWGEDLGAAAGTSFLPGGKLVQKDATNIAVTQAGKYDIELDLKDAKNPIFKVIKK